MKRTFGAMILAVLLAGCTPVERQAYKTVVAAKAFLDSVKGNHPECATGTASTLCADLTRATAAKDVLISAGEAYCSGPGFETGGACNPPAKGTPGATQAAAKLKAALADYDLIEKNLKLAVGK